MTATEIEDIALHKFTADDRLFFDANVWLFVNGPQGNPRDGAVLTYSNALKLLQRAGSELCVDSIVLSEFANAFARIELNAGGFGAKYASFKEFRDGPEFRDSVAPAISIQIRRILGWCKVIDTRLSAFDTQDILTLFSEGGHDFNDLVIAEVCRNEGLTLVTDDAGFAGANIKILSCNGKLLNP